MGGFRRLGVTMAAMLGMAAASPAPAALAWGVEGHRVIADIAARHLTPVAEQEVERLLALEGANNLAAISMVADDIRPHHPETRRWHFANIPVSAPTYDARRDCPRNACVVAKLEYFAAVLADPRQPDSMRLPALEFVTHFAGDLHQPLHVTDNHDRGGNKVRVYWYGHPTSLHHVWDTELVRAAGPEHELTAELDDRVPPYELAKLAAGSPELWATEAHLVAVHEGYGSLPEDGELTDAYVEQGIRAVDLQLERAGVRLARILNEAMANYTGQ